MSDRMTSVNLGGFSITPRKSEKRTFALTDFIADMATKENDVEVNPFFVNREEALKLMAEHMHEFIVLAGESAMDIRRELPSMFSDGMFGKGKTEMGAQAILQFNSRKTLLNGLSESAAAALKSTWFCFVDIARLKVPNTSHPPGKALFIAAFVHALANARRAVEGEDKKWRYSLVLSPVERQSFRDSVADTIRNKGLGAVHGYTILACFREALAPTQLNARSQHILLHIDEAAVISESETENDEKRKRLLEFWDDIPFTTPDRKISIQPYFSSRYADLSLVGVGTNDSPTLAERIEFDLLALDNVRALFASFLPHREPVSDDVLEEITQATAGVPRLVWKVLHQLKAGKEVPALKDVREFVYKSCKGHVKNWKESLSKMILTDPDLFKQLMFFALLGAPVSREVNILDDEGNHQFDNNGNKRKEFVLSAARRAGFYCRPMDIREQKFYIVAIPPVLLRALAEDPEMKKHVDLTDDFLPERGAPSWSYDPDSFEFAVCCSFKVRAHFAVHCNTTVSGVIGDFKWKDVVEELDGSYFGQASVEPHMLWTVLTSATENVKTRLAKMTPQRKDILMGIAEHCASSTYGEAFCKFNGKEGYQKINPLDLPKVCAGLQSGQLAVSGAQSGTADAMLRGNARSLIQLWTVWAALQPKRYTSSTFDVAKLKEEVEKSMKCVSVTGQSRMTIIIVLLKVPAFVTEGRSRAYYKSGAKFNITERGVNKVWCIPDNVDVLILSQRATERLLSAAVFKYFSTLGHTSPEAAAHGSSAGSRG